MASSKPSSSIIDFDDSRPELQFQDFAHEDSTSAATLEASEQFTTFPNSPDASESADLLGQEQAPSSSFWEFKYYQNFFDIDTDQVLQRITGSILPMPGRATFLDRLIRPSPDLYGPFWISTTLVFSVAISANIAEYFMTEGNKKVWHYDLNKVSLAATAIYSYVFLLPFAVWGVLWYRYNIAQYTLLEVICVYGYSLFIYIPLSILWLIQAPWLQWILLVIGATLSGSVLVHTFWSAVREGSKKIGILLLCVILLLHVLLAVGFVSYFFRPPHSSSIKHLTEPPHIVSVIETTSVVNPPKVTNLTLDNHDAPQKVQMKNSDSKGPLANTKTNSHPMKANDGTVKAKSVDTNNANKSSSSEHSVKISRETIHSFISPKDLSKSIS